MADLVHAVKAKQLMPCGRKPLRVWSAALTWGAITKRTGQ
jgi:hypothetical protein